MTKEEIIKALEDAKVDISLTKEGEIRADLLELALDGVNARTAKEALTEEVNSYKETVDSLNKRIEELEGNSGNEETYKSTIETLNKRIEELEEQKTPVEKADLIYRKKDAKKYRMKLPSTNFKGRKINAEILNKDQSLLEELFATKTSLLVEEGKED